MKSNIVLYGPTRVSITLLVEACWFAIKLVDQQGSMVSSGILPNNWILLNLIARLWTNNKKKPAVYAGFVDFLGC